MEADDNRSPNYEKIQQPYQVIPGEFIDDGNLEQYHFVKRAVCRVEDADAGNVLGTGFLIAPGLVLTTYHVVDGVKNAFDPEDKAGKLGFRFGYSEYGAIIHSGKLYQAQPSDALVAFSEAVALDYAL